MTFTTAHVRAKSCLIHLLLCHPSITVNGIMEVCRRVCVCVFWLGLRTTISELLGRTDWVLSLFILFSFQYPTNKQTCAMVTVTCLYFCSRFQRMCPFVRFLLLGVGGCFFPLSLKKSERSHLEPQYVKTCTFC